MLSCMPWSRVFWGLWNRNEHIVTCTINTYRNSFKYHQLQSQCLNDGCFSKRDFCRQCRPQIVNLSAYISLHLISSSSQASSPLHPTDSNVYSAIKTQPIKGDVSGARLWRGARSCREGSYKSLRCRPESEEPDSWAGGSELSEFTGTRSQSADDSWASLLTADHSGSAWWSVYWACALGREETAAFLYPPQSFVWMHSECCYSSAAVKT